MTDAANPLLYVFTESVAAGSLSPWHIRRLGARGLRLNGGADTPSLCGRQMSWDIDCPVKGPALEEACKKCRAIYLTRISEVV